MPNKFDTDLSILMRIEFDLEAMENIRSCAWYDRVSIVELRIAIPEILWGDNSSNQSMLQTTAFAPNFERIPSILPSILHNNSIIVTKL